PLTRASQLYVVSGFSRTARSAGRGCEQITFNAETAEAAEKKCLRISLRALRALRSNVEFFHRLFSRTREPSGASLSSHLHLRDPRRRDLLQQGLRRRDQRPAPVAARAAAGSALRSCRR